MGWEEDIIILHDIIIQLKTVYIQKQLVNNWVPYESGPIFLDVQLNFQPKRTFKEENIRVLGTKSTML